MNSKEIASLRMHALREKIPTAGWTPSDFQNYKESRFEKGNHSKVSTAEVVELPKPEPKSSGTVDKAITDLIAAMDLQREVSLDEERVIELIAQHSKRVVVEIQDHKTGEVREVEGAHKMFPTVLNCIAAGVNVAAVGPAGSGKSTIFEMAAKELGLDYYFTGAVQQEHKIMGYQDGHGVYHRTPFRDAFENGGLFVMEEFDGSGARALLAINNAAANDWCDFPDGMVKKHKDFVLVMAGNTFGTGASRQYVGRQQIDGATLDRFAFIEVGYDEDLETAITLAINPEAGKWVQKVQAFRHAVDRAGLRHIVSPRASIMGAKLLKQGMDEQTITQIVLHKGMTQDQIRQVSS